MPLLRPRPTWHDPLPADFLKEIPRLSGTRPIVYVCYWDHVLFKDTNVDLCCPMLRETVGWLDHEDSTCVRIVWERMANSLIEADKKSTGLVILKSAILQFKIEGKVNQTPAREARSAQSTSEHSSYYRPQRTRGKGIAR